ncbi:hypothetical protein ACI65C_008971 [Semiaphis heraclei]
MSKRENKNVLSNYFSKLPKTDKVPILLPQIETPSPSCSHSPTDLQTNKSNLLKSDAEQIVEDNDIGYCFGKNVSDEIKFKLITDHWSPDENYKFLITTNLKKKLKFQLGWIKRFPWVAYSKIGDQGAVCKYCAIFGREFGGKGSHQKLISLVVKPFNNWKTAIEKFNEHSKTEFHKSNAMRADNFVAVYSKNCQNIIQKLDSAQDFLQFVPVSSTTGNFIKISAKRTELLKNKIKEFLPQTKWTKLTSMCETRWVENHDGMLRFSEIYKPIVATLEELQLFVDIETSSKALQLYKCVTTSEFIISMITATTLFSITLPLCKILQSVKCDLSEAVDHVETVLNEVKDMRTKMNENFKEIFNKSEQLFISVNDEEKIKIPRLVSRSKIRINVDTKIPEDYFRIVIAIPFYDDFISQLKERFSKHKKILSSLYLLIPKMCLKSPILESDFSLYSDFINVDTLPSELKLWKRKWIAFKDVDRPHTAVESLNYCNPELFPNIHFLLKVLATLPVSTSTPERTFSTLKRVKTFLRNSTGQERLTGLALLSVHRDITVNPDEVLNQFALQKDRNILLV